jgi:hypothetical protein
MSNRTKESIDDRLEAIRHLDSVEPVLGAPLPRELPGESPGESLSDEPAPESAVAGNGDAIPRQEQGQETFEKDSPESSFGASDIPENEDELLSAAGIPLEEEADEDEDDEEDSDYEIDTELGLELDLEMEDELDDLADEDDDDFDDDEDEDEDEDEDDDEEDFEQE